MKLPGGQVILGPPRMRTAWSPRVIGRLRSSFFRFLSQEDIDETMELKLFMPELKGRVRDVQKGP